MLVRTCWGVLYRSPCFMWCSSWGISTIGIWCYQSSVGMSFEVNQFRANHSRNHQQPGGNHGNRHYPRPLRRHLRGGGGCHFVGSLWQMMAHQNLRLPILTIERGILFCWLSLELWEADTWRLCWSTIDLRGNPVDSAWTVRFAARLALIGGSHSPRCRICRTDAQGKLVSDYLVSPSLA